MAHFKSEADMRGGYYANGHGKAPRGMTKAQQKAFVASTFWAWSECDCKGVPGRPERADYYVHNSKGCSTDAKVKGNFPDDR
jgi:hypothetical protein